MRAGLIFSLLALTATLAACPKAKLPDATDAGPSAGERADLSALARAEDLRRAKDVPASALTSHDVATRRRAARALARIADPETDDALLRALSDEDEETVAWGAYGLAWTCKGREDVHVRALAARGASLGERPAPQKDDADRRDAVDARMALARAIGRCGDALAEGVLTAWLRTRSAWTELAAYALADVAARRGGLGDEAKAALLDAARPGPTTPALDAALVAFGRLEHVDDALVSRVLAVSRDALSRPGPLRAFAVRALARCGGDGARDLERVVEGKEFTTAERAEAARGLGLQGDGGHLAAADALARLTPDKDPIAITALGGDEFGVLASLVASLGADPPKKAEPALYALAALSPPGPSSASLTRRIAELRCAAAGALASGSFDASLLKQCDPDPTNEARERARLASLVRRPLTGERRAAWKALTKSAHPRVREAALDAIAQHAELADAAKTALAEALGAGKAGLVATAAEVIRAHPDRVLALAESERRAALDPNAPPPSASPARELDAQVAAALKGALDVPWPEDAVETRAALIDAAVSVRHPSAREAALTACKDANATMRDHAAKALRALGEPSPSCPPPPSPSTATATPLTHDTKVTFQTDAGDLSIVFEPALAPMAVTRFVALARAGFYRRIVVHRVVPGFVAQFGDPDGDGFGGSGALLRCETSPVPFGRFDVGVALAGRDTGSSQLFVTLARFPHLDGEYARVGRASGDWDALAEGDVIREVTVDE